MPIYVYNLLDEAGTPTGEQFEELQRMRDEALTTQPGTGKPCRRAVTLPRTAETVFMPGEGESIQEGWHPSEVDSTRKMFGHKGGDCIKDDGRVVFAGSRERDQYQKRKQELKNSGQLVV